MWPGQTATEGMDEAAAAAVGWSDTVCDESRARSPHPLPSSGVGYAATDCGSPHEYAGLVVSSGATLLIEAGIELITRAACLFSGTVSAPNGSFVWTHIAAEYINVAGGGGYLHLPLGVQLESRMFTNGGDTLLNVDAGGKLVLQGTADSPVIFNHTSDNSAITGLVLAAALFIQPLFQIRHAIFTGGFYNGMSIRLIDGVQVEVEDVTFLNTRYSHLSFDQTGAGGIYRVRRCRFVSAHDSTGARYGVLINTQQGWLLRRVRVRLRTAISKEGTEVSVRRAAPATAPDT